MNRIITGAIAIALAGSVPFVAASTAEAAPAVGHRTVATTAHAPAARQLPRRQIAEKIVARGTHKLIFKGKVKGQPHYSNKVVKIQRKISKSGHWKPFSKTQTGKLGGFHERVPAGGRNCDSSDGSGGGCWYFRAVTPKTDKFRTSHSAGKYFTFTY